MASAIAAIPTSRTSAVKCPCSLMMGGTRAPLRDARRLILGDRCLEIYPSDELSFPAERCIASPPERSTIMEGSAERYDALQRAGARRLTGFQRRLFLAEVAIELCEGRARNAERRFGWGRETVEKGLHELQHGMRCLENFAARGRQRCEQKDPQLAADIRALVEPHTHAAPELKSSRRYTNLSAAEVRQALIDKGYPRQGLPSERTMRDNPQLDELPPQADPEGPAAEEDRPDRPDRRDLRQRGGGAGAGPGPARDAGDLDGHQGEGGPGRLWARGEKPGRAPTVR